MLANQFEKNIQTDNGEILLRLDSGLVEPMKDVPWFRVDLLYDLINNWPMLPLTSQLRLTDFIALHFR